MGSSSTLNQRVFQTKSRLTEGWSDASRGIPALPSSSGRGRSGAGVSAELEGLLNAVRFSMQCNLDSARAAAVRLVELLGRPDDAEPGGAVGGLAPWQKRKVDRYLQEHLADPLHLSELARQASLSVSYFCRAFRDSYGTSPHKHIIRLRLELAQRLMVTTKDPLSQIALACGMADQAHLCKLFRRGVGETPGAWRRRSLTDAQIEARCFPATASQFVRH
jgi:AraC family transcriptional regulator